MTSLVENLARVYALGHRNALDAVVDLDGSQLRWRPLRSNSVAFNLWHIARWADHLQSILSTMTPELRERIGASPEVWARDALARKWDFPAQGLGQVETGMGMDEDLSATLPLPDKAELVGYAKLAFDAADRAVAAVRDEDLEHAAELEPARVPWLSSPQQYGTVASWLVASIRHESRHLGMIEAIKGAGGLRGTVTV